MRRRRASRIEANNRPGETGGGSRANERGKGAPGVSLSVHGSAAGCNLMSFLCWFRLYRVTRVSRSFVFVFRVFHHHHRRHHLLPFLPLFLELSSVSDPFKIRLLSCRLGCRRLWLKAIRPLKRDHLLSLSLFLAKRFFVFVSQGILSYNFHPKFYNDSILFPSIFLDNYPRIAPVRIAARLGASHLCPRWDASPIICRALDILLY